ncbi:MAG: hypothetical protein HYR56_35445 [Acidobacteria bacterium]|nr:hypothetical protein [Acidobacteriota bacterium]MBI3424362.1 hypothetical protein [Acidobacteriota bacterium]
MNRMALTHYPRWIALMLACLLGSVAHAQTTAFTYQGKLTDAGNPANGIYDLQFRLFDALVGGNQAGSTLIREDVPVSNGIFSVTLDFGAAAFPGANRWLEIGVRPGVSTGAFTALAPLQPITSTPYAIKSLSAASADAAATATTATNATNAASADALSAACNGCVSGAKLADGGITNAKIVDVAGSKITGALTTATIPGANVTGAVANATNATNATSAANATNATNATNAANATNAVSATNATTAANFSGALAGDVTGNQNTATVVKLRNLPLPTPVQTDDGKVLRYKNDGVNPASFELAATSGGTISGVTVGTGLSGGGTTGNVTVGIAASGVSATELAANAVTTAKLADNNVTTAKLADASVTTAKLADGSVTDTKIATVAGSKITGTIPVAGVPAGSASYIQNSTTQQASSNFNISGNGTAGGTLSGNIVNVTTQYNLGGNRVLNLGPNTGVNNLLVGLNAGNALTDGRENIFIGSGAGQATTGGALLCANCGPGGAAIFAGSHNAFAGYSAGRANTMGFSNSFSGAYAGYNNLGSNNSFSGYAAGFSNTIASNNSFSGAYAGYSNTTGGENTALGYLANFGTASLNNVTAIGARAQVDCGNCLVLGSINGVNGATADTNVGIGTTSPGYKLHIQSSGILEANINSVNERAVLSLGSNLQNQQQVWTIESGVLGTPGLFGIFDRTASQPRLVIRQNGDVGIGTSLPLRTFHVNGTSVFTERMDATGVISGITSNLFAIYGGSGGTGTGVGIYGYVNPNSGGWAGWFEGRVRVNGTLTKNGGSFQIDHPLDPENKYLSHSFVESPDMMNIYNGNVATDASGEATITLPDYFTALNRDFRYQLTVIGQFAQAMVSRKIQDNHFTIKTDKPNVEVSWQVTGIRQDAWANAHRIAVEETKTEKERGHYLNPEVFGQPEEKGIEWARHPDLMQRQKAEREKRLQQKPNER